MKKKFIMALLPLLFLGFCNSVIGMHGKALRCVQVGSSVLVIGVFAKKSYEKNEEIKKTFIAPEAPQKVKNMVHEGLAKLHVPNYDKVPVLQFAYHGSPWAIINDRAIVVDPQVAAAIVAGDEKIIAQSEAIKKHEFKHLLNGDVQKRVYAWGVIPCIVQAGSSLCTYGFNKVFKIQQPKTIFSLVGRSTMAVGAIVPKCFIAAFGIIGYIRYQESEADLFACEHADSKEELEAFKGFFDGLTELYEQDLLQQPKYVEAHETGRNKMMWRMQFILDKEHPCSADRSAMIQEYIDKWDEEHDEENKA